MVDLDIVYLIYGAAFILLSLVCVTLSYCDRSLPWRCLALFGLLHGIHEWIEMLLILSQRSSSSIVLTASLNAASFVALFEFGWIAVTQHYTKRKSPASPYTSLLMVIVFVMVPMAYLNVVIRYGLALPAAVFSALGCFITASKLYRTTGIRQIPLYICGSILLAYGVAAGMIIPEPNPQHHILLLSSDRFVSVFHIPIQLVRAGCAIFIFAVLTYKAISSISRNKPSIINRNDMIRLSAVILVVVSCGSVLIRNSSIYERQRIYTSMRRQAYIMVAPLTTAADEGSAKVSDGNRRVMQLIKAMLTSQPLVHGFEITRLSNSGERRAVESYRNSVAVMSVEKALPVIATSRAGGYRLAITVDQDQLARQLITTRQPTLMAISLTLLTVLMLSGIAVTYRYERMTLRTINDKLALSEARFRSYVEQSPIGFALVDANNHVLQANNALCRILQMPKDELVNHPVIEPVNIPESFDWRSLFRVVLADLSKGNTQMHYVCPDGVDKWLDCLAMRIYDSDTGHAQVMVQIMDISDRKNAEQAYATLLKTPIYGLFMVSPDGTVLFSNENGATLTGHTTQSIIGTNIFESIDNDSVARYQSLFSQMVESKQPYSIEDTYSSIIVELDGFPILGDTGDVSAVVVFIQDVSELHRQRELLETEIKRNRQLNDIIDRSEIIVMRIALKPVPQITYISNGVTTLGYQPAEMTAENFNIHSFLPLTEFYRIWRTSTKHRKNGELTFTHEMTVMTAEEQPRQIEWRVQLFPGEDGRSDYVEAIGTDVTMRREMELEHQKLVDQLYMAQKNESLTLLAGGIAHDFNNLLLVISGNAELAMEHTGLHPDVKDSLNEIMEGAKQAARLSGLMLAYSGNIISTHTEASIVDPLVRAIEEIKRRNQQLCVDITIPDGSPLLLIDTNQMQQAFVAVLENAIEASLPPFRVSVDVDQIVIAEHDISTYQPSDSSDAGEYVRICIRDNGHGITEEQLNKVIDPFYTSKQMGRGLGLASVFGIMKAHNGLIKIESEEGHGTTVTLCLPIRLTESPMFFGN